MSRTTLTDFFNGSGLGPLPNGSPNGGSLVPFPIECFVTPVLDLTIPTLGLEIIPARPGFYPFLQNLSWVIENLAGVQTTPPTIQAGSDPAHMNMLTPFQTPSNANLATILGSTPATAGGGNSVSGTQQFPNAPAFLDITIGSVGTGGFVLRARAVVRVGWIGVG